MNIARDFADQLISLGFGTTFGTDVFIGGAPQEANECWWIVSAGGSPEVRNQTGEVRKNYILNVFYRSTDEESVYNEMQSLEIELNKSNCLQLSNFDTIEIVATLFPTDQDIDSQERTVGTIQVAIKTYYKE